MADLSVVIPTFNRADLVGRAIDSVLSQATSKSVQVIVVDDASTDATPSVLEQFGSSIEVVRNEAPRERAASRNLGARQAQGDVVAFLDSDDEWLPGKVAQQLPVAQSGAVSVTGIEIVNQRGDVVRTHIPPANAPDRILYENQFLAAPSTLMLPLAVFEAVGGFPEDLRVQGSEDWLILAKLLHSGHSIAVVQKPLARYRLHGANSTADPSRVAASMWAAIEWMENAAILDHKRGRYVRAHVAGVVGRQFAARARWSEAFEWGRTALASNPWPVGARSCLLIAGSALRGRLPRASLR